jgi:TPP-dependent pyruvate/acetoin dehydrogenase alpha subunit
MTRFLSLIPTAWSGCRQMLRIREFEERVKATFTEHPGVIRGHTHLADGAEASIVGSLAALRRSPGPGDQVMATYRCHGYPLVLGSDPNAMMAEIYGRATGLCGGCAGRADVPARRGRRAGPAGCTGSIACTRCVPRTGPGPPCR